MPSNSGLGILQYIWRAPQYVWDIIVPMAADIQVTERTRDFFELCNIGHIIR